MLTRAELLNHLCYEIPCITTFSFNEDHGKWGEYLDLKPDIADGKTNRGYWVRNMYLRYLFMVWLREFTISKKPIPFLVF
jgi:hypothetical protein